MPLVVLVLIVCAGLLALGFAIDFFVRRKKIAVDVENGVQHAKSTDQVYAEMFLHEARIDITHGPN
jgi:hypothetical protein